MGAPPPRPPSSTPTPPSSSSAPSRQHRPPPRQGHGPHRARPPAVAVRRLRARLHPHPGARHPHRRPRRTRPRAPVDLVAKGDPPPSTAPSPTRPRHLRALHRTSPPRIDRRDLQPRARRVARHLRRSRAGPSRPEYAPRSGVRLPYRTVPCGRALGPRLASSPRFLFSRQSPQCQPSLCSECSSSHEIFRWRLRDQDGIHTWPRTRRSRRLRASPRG
jgi:hypothetical protein